MLVSQVRSFLRYLQVFKLPHHQALSSKAPHHLVATSLWLSNDVNYVCCTNKMHKSSLDSRGKRVMNICKWNMFSRYCNTIVIVYNICYPFDIFEIIWPIKEHLRRIWNSYHVMLIQWKYHFPLCLNIFIQVNKPIFFGLFSDLFMGK